MNNRVPQEQIEWLRRIPLFAGWSDRELALIDRLVDEIDVPAGDVLTRQGRAGARESFVIVSGRAEVQINGSRVATLGPGDIVGEMAMLDNRPRTATVTAATRMELLVIGPSAFGSFLDRPGIATRLLETVNGRLRKASTGVATSAATVAERRTA
jgi:cAMP-dependent protein kinase regulator